MCVCVYHLNLIRSVRTNYISLSIYIRNYIYVRKFFNILKTKCKYTRIFYIRTRIKKHILPLSPQNNTAAHTSLSSREKKIYIYIYTFFFHHIDILSYIYINHHLRFVVSFNAHSLTTLSSPQVANIFSSFGCHVTPLISAACPFSTLHINFTSLSTSAL